MRLERLRHARRLAGMSQVELAKAAGLDRGSVSRLEVGHRGAQPGTTRRLAEALGVEVEALLGAEREGAKA